MAAGVRLSSIVVISYLLSGVIILSDKIFNYDVAWYYLFYMAMNFFISWLCCTEDDYPSLIYGVINAAHVVFYFPFLFGDYNFVISLLYSSTYSLKNIMLSYEILILGYGGSVGLLAIYNRLWPAGRGNIPNMSHH